MEKTYWTEYEGWENNICTGSFGAYIHRNKIGSSFTIEKANSLLEDATKFWEEKHGKQISFCKVKCNMTDYDNANAKEKIGTYDKRTNCLRIYEDGVPVYENLNGQICRDTVALMDSDADNAWNHYEYEPD